VITQGFIALPSGTSHQAREHNIEVMQVDKETQEIIL
jgi:hypothetical protein